MSVELDCYLLYPRSTEPRSWQRVTSCKPPHSESKDFGMKKRRQIEAGFVGQPSSHVREEDEFGNMGLAVSTIVPDAANEP